MKIIMSIVLIILMGINNHKENNMPVDEGNRETIRTRTAIRERVERPMGRTQRTRERDEPVVERPPAWMGRTQRTREDEPAAPSWLETIRNRLNDNPIFGQTSLGGGNGIVPNFNTQQSIAQGQQNYLQNHNGPSPIAAPAPGQIGQAQQMPAWLQTIQNRINNSPYLSPTGGLGGGNAPVPNFYNPANDGNVYNNSEQGLTPQGTPTHGVNSFIGGGGDAVIGPNGLAYTPWAPAGVNTFIGGGGQAVRGPGYSTLAVPAPTPVSNNNNFSFATRYGRGGGGGGGGWDNSGGYDKPAWMSNDPRYMNLYSWNI